MHDADSGERHSLAEDQYKNVAARRAQRGSHANLTHSLGDAAGEDAVDAHGCEY